MTIAALLAADRLTSLDRGDIESFKRKAPEKYRLHPELGPSAYEGDIDNARIVLLLANPGFDSTSTADDHNRKRKTFCPPPHTKKSGHSRFALLAAVAD
jgi:hypothetical protein